MWPTMVVMGHIGLGKGLCCGWVSARFLSLRAPGCAEIVRIGTEGWRLLADLSMSPATPESFVRRYVISTRLVPTEHRVSRHLSNLLYGIGRHAQRVHHLEHRSVTVQTRPPSDSYDGQASGGSYMRTCRCCRRPGSLPAAILRASHRRGLSCLAVCLSLRMP